MTKKKSVSTGRWTVEDSEGLTFLLREVVSREDAVVELDAHLGAWVCSACGAFRFADAKSGMLTCQHITAVTRRMPQNLVIRAASIAAPPRRLASAARNDQIPTAIERQMTQALERGAEARARRAAEHDSTYRPMVGDVTVRRITDADRIKLAERRRRKRIGD